MKRMMLVLSMAGLLLEATLADAEPRTHGEIRGIVEAVVDTEYCGTAMMNGINSTTALCGESPIAGVGFVRLEEEEWRPVLLAMAREEFEKCQDAMTNLSENVREARDALAASLEARRPKQEVDTAHRALLTAEHTLNQRLEKLQRMLPALGRADGDDADLDAFLKRVVQECPRECDALNTGIQSAVARALLTQRAGACKELGEWIRDTYGLESAEHVMFCRSLFNNAGLIRTDSELGIVARYLLSSVELAKDYGFCHSFDMYAKDDLPGWKGSLQRKRLAERFPNEPLPRFRHWDEEKQEMVDGDVIQAMLPLLLANSATEELAKEESDLTDLRNVYGDWTEETPEE